MANITIDGPVAMLPKTFKATNSMTNASIIIVPHLLQKRGTLKLIPWSLRLSQTLLLSSEVLMIEY